MRNFNENLKMLSEVIGTCGDEGSVRKLIYDEVISYPDCIAKTDNIGNLIVTKKGEKQPKNKIMFTAQMDEVGFIVTDIDENGFIKFSCIGEIDSRVILGKPILVGKSKLPGLLGSKAIHLVKKEEFDKPAKTNNLYIDIGADSKEEAEKLVSLGDRIVFDSDFNEFGEGFVMGKALDSRVGAAILMELLKEKAEYEYTVCFTVRGELNGNGASSAAFSVKPNIGIAVGYVPAGDMPTSCGKTICKIGEGAVVAFRDRATLYDMDLYRVVMEEAKSKDIKVQTKHGICGSNEAESIHKAAGGIRPVSVAVPVRNSHSAYPVLKTSDCEHAVALVKTLSRRLCEV